MIAWIATLSEPACWGLGISTYLFIMILFWIGTNVYQELKGSRYVKLFDSSMDHNFVFGLLWPVTICQMLVYGIIIFFGGFDGTINGISRWIALKLQRN
jgi:hypothetical protein